MKVNDILKGLQKMASFSRSEETYQTIKVTFFLETKHNVKDITPPKKKKKKRKRERQDVKQLKQSGENSC